MESKFSTTAESNNSSPVHGTTPPPSVRQKLISPTPIPETLQDIERTRPGSMDHDANADPLPARLERPRSLSESSGSSGSIPAVKPTEKQPFVVYTATSYGDATLVNSSPGFSPRMSSVSRTPALGTSAGATHIGDIRKRGALTSFVADEMDVDNTFVQPRRRESQKGRSFGSFADGKAAGNKSGKSETAYAREPRKKRSFGTFAEELPVENSPVKVQRIDDERRALTQTIVKILDRAALENLVITAALRDPSIMADIITSHSQLQEEQDADDESGPELENARLVRAAGQSKPTYSKSIRRSTIDAPEIKTEQPTGYPRLVNNAPGYKYKHFEAKPTPPGVDDSEWDKIYVCANSRMYSKYCDKKTAETRRARDNGKTYNMALVILDERRVQQPWNQLLGTSKGQQPNLSSQPTQPRVFPPKEKTIRPHWATAPHKKGASPNRATASIQPARSLHSRSRRRTFPPSKQTSNNPSTSSYRFVYPEAYPAPLGIENDDWNMAYVSANGRLLAQHGAQKAHTYRIEGETSRLALEAIQGTNKTQPQGAESHTPAPSGSKSKVKSSQPSSAKRSFESIEPQKPADISLDKWKRIFNKANARIYYNTSGFWGTYRKSAEHAGDLRKRGETLKVALQIVEEERDQTKTPSKKIAMSIPRSQPTPKASSEAPLRKSFANDFIMVDDRPVSAPPQEAQVRPTHNGLLPVGLLKGHENVVKAGFDRRMYWMYRISQVNREGHNIGMPLEKTVATKREQVDLFPDLRDLSDEDLRKEVLRMQIAGEN